MIDYAKHIILVVSPLAALMAEQKRFVPMRINTEFFGDLQTDLTTVERVRSGQHSLVIISPENLCYNHVLREMLLLLCYLFSFTACGQINECGWKRFWHDKYQTLSRCVRVRKGLATLD